MSQFSGNAERLTGSNRGVFPLYAGASTCRFQARSVFNICNICKYASKDGLAGEGGELEDAHGCKETTLIVSFNSNPTSQYVAWRAYP